MTPANINRTVVRNIDKFNRSDNIVDVNEVDKNETIDSHMHRSIRTPLRMLLFVHYFWQYIV
jgi:hypothetical protein